MWRAASFVLLVALFAGSARAQDGRPDRAGARVAASLSEAERGAALWPFADEEREEVRFAPLFLDGVEHGDLPEGTASLVEELLAASLSRRGHEKVRAIRELERAVRVKERGELRSLIMGGFRDPRRYFLALFGEPGPDAPWGYRYEGHHVSLNVTVVPGRPPASTPLFLGAEPRVVPGGWPGAGTAALGEEEALARALHAALPPPLRARATLPYQAGRDLMLGQVARLEPGQPAGVPRGEMEPAQRAQLDALVELFVSNWSEPIAAARRAEIEAGGRDAIHFAHVEADEPPHAFYTRLQGPAFVIEIDNTTDGDHLHAVWHGIGTDFGDDLLAQHYAREHGVALAR